MGFLKILFPFYPGVVLDRRVKQSVEVNSWLLFCRVKFDPISSILCESHLESNLSIPPIFRCLSERSFCLVLGCQEVG